MLLGLEGFLDVLEVLLELGAVIGVDRVWHLRGILCDGLCCFLLDQVFLATLIFLSGPNLTSCSGTQPQ